MATGSSPEPQPGTSGYCNQPIDCAIGRDVFCKVARDIGTNWKWLGRELGMEDTKLEIVKANYSSEGVDEAAYQMLQVWQRRLGKGATVSILAEGLRKIDQANLSSEILKMAEDSNEKLNATEMPNFLQSSLRKSASCIVDAEIVRTIARHVSTDWKWLGREFGVEDEKLDGLKVTHSSEGIEELAYQMIKVWQERWEEEATVNVLAEHLKKIGRAELASKILKLAEEPNKKSDCPQPFRRHKTGRSSLRTSGADWESITTTLRTDHGRLQIPKMPWLEKKWETGFEDFYVDLTISNKNKDATPLQLHEIFNSVPQSSHKLPTRILIEGPAGYGKSTLARKLCFDHALEKSYIQHFDAVILLRLREFHGTLEEMIIDTYELENCSAEILTQNQSKILFVLDGFDEMHPDNHPHVIPLLKGKQYPQSTVIVTSRMGYMKLEGEKPGSSVTNLLHCMTSRISIVGVTGEKRVAFLQLYLKGYSSEKCASFIKSTDKKFGLSKTMEGNLFDCPLYLLLLVVAAEETDLASLRSRTQLYKHLFNFILRRTLAKEGQVDQTCDFFEFCVENPPSHVAMLFRFGSIAGQALLNKQYTFTEEEILRACGNDSTILKLGILTHNDSKIGPTRTSWFEPIHLSFLEFAFVYSLWVGSVSTHPFLPFHHSINMVDLWHLLNGYNVNFFVASFLCGLCWKQLPTLLSAFTFHHLTMARVMLQLDQEEMTAENKLELSEAFLPLIPVEFTVEEDFLEISVPTLLKHAVQTRTDQRIIVERKFWAIEQPQGYWLKVTPRNSAILQDWRELATSQNIKFGTSVFSQIIFKLCEAPLQQQLQWLSDFMTVEGILQNSIHTITCPSKQLPKLIDLMTDLIRQERVTRVALVRYGCEWSSAESWKEFMCCANESKKLLDMFLWNRAESPLVVDLTPAEGKRWRMVQLAGDVVVSVGSQLVSELNEYGLDALLRGMPSNIQSLEIPYCIRVVRNDGLPTAHNVEELVIGVFNLSLLKSSVPECLKHLKVLAIEVTSEMSDHDLTTFLLSVIFHCHSLVRIELGHKCTEQLIAAFLQRFSRDKGPALTLAQRLLFRIQAMARAVLRSDRGKSVPTHLHLNTLMIPANESVLTCSTANLVKEALKTSCIERLWVRCTEYGDANTMRKFMELFSPAEFNMKTVDEQSWSKHTDIEPQYFLIKKGTRCILEVSVN